MNAIAGIVSKSREPKLKTVVKNMLEIQSHKGQNREIITSCNDSYFGIRYGSIPKNSSVNDIPIFNKDRSIFLVGDFGIYNYNNLKKLLEKRKRELKMTGDSALMIALYEELGISFLKYLRGDFAFFLLDTVKKKFFLVRDRFGMRPLFYYYKNGSFLFSSELKALVKFGSVDRTLDLSAIYHYLFFTFFYQPQTPFRYIRSVLYGNYLSYDLETNEIKMSPYWQVPYSSEKSYDEKFLITESSKLLRESILIRNNNDSPVGVSLSGGIDSSLIAATLADTNSKIHTFTIGFEDEHSSINEFEYAQKVAELIGSSHIESIITPFELLNDLPKLVWSFDTPTAGTILPYFVAKSASQAKIDMIFRGDGAHSVFEVPAEKKFRVLQYLFTYLDILPNEIIEIIINNCEEFFSFLEPYARKSSSTFSAAIRLFSSYFKARVGKHNLDIMFTKKERKSMFITPFWENSLEFRDTENLILNCMNSIATSDLQDKLIYEEYRRFPSQGLSHNSSVNASFSIDNRQPYYDHKLVEFSQNYLPISFRLKDGIDKYILKRISEKILPDYILKRAQHPFVIPINKWFNNELKPLIDSIFFDNKSAIRELFHSNSLNSIYRKYYNSKNRHESFRKIWSIVILEIWLRLYYERSDIETPNFTGKEMIY